MAANTYVALDSQTLVSTTSSITFNSISQSYTDLIVVCSINSARAAQYDSLAVRFNGDAGSNYSYTYMQGNTSNGANTISGRAANQSNIFIGNVTASSVTNNFSACILQVQNYSNATTYKTAIARGGSIIDAGNNDGELVVGMWRNTNAITSLTVRSETGSNFNVGCTFTLYGVAAASVGAKATGGAIYQDASYFYHVFAGNGTFTPASSLSADVLCVAGGGGGSGYGAGGAGGVSYQSARSLSATGYTITVGAGGGGVGSFGGATGGSGVNSTFDTITSNGGGGGRTGNTGVAGGSGGGGSYNNTAGGASNQGNTGGATGYGNAGGTGYTDNSTIFNSGGGGGAGAAGNAGTATPVNGGNGLSTWTSWGTATGIGESISGTYYLAGGGGGCSRNVNNNGRGGYGGGGYGGNRNMPIGANGVSALINTGGGGGAGDDATGGNGGSGVVIVRYAK